MDLGARATLADINLMPYAARLDYLGLLDLWTADRPRMRDWWEQARNGRASSPGFKTSSPSRNSRKCGPMGPRSGTTWPSLIAGLRRGELRHDRSLERR